MAIFGSECFIGLYHHTEMKFNVRSSTLLIFINFQYLSLLQFLLGVAWLVQLTFVATSDLSDTQPLNFKEWQQVSSLPNYISNVQSRVNSSCQLQYECTRCLPSNREKPIEFCSGQSDLVFYRWKCQGNKAWATEIQKFATISVVDGVSNFTPKIITKKTDYQTCIVKL